jgi:8-oxo-dGTP diphosphatase
VADTPKHSVSVAGIVVDDQDRVLVIQRRDNEHWEPPGGVLELPETFEQGVRREIAEEAGVAVSVDRLTGIYKNMKLGVVALVFRCTPVRGQAHSTFESRQVKWLTLGEVTDLMLPAYAVRVEDAFSDQVSVRSHDGTQLIATP